MDDFEGSASDLDLNLLELEFINRYLGGHAVSFDGILKLNPGQKKKIKVLDIGCGGGDTMIAIYQFLKKKGIEAEMIGLDANPKALEYAQKRCAGYPHFQWRLAPFQSQPEIEADIYHAALFAHHFYEHDLKILGQYLSLAQLGFVVNDLHRHPLAYYSIKFLSQWFSKSYLLKNDAPLSVARGFSKKEIAEFLENLPGTEVEISWKWAFRWLATGKKNGKS